MLKIYGVLMDSKLGSEYVAFYLKKSDADADAENSKDCVVVPIEIREEYPSLYKED